MEDNDMLELKQKIDKILMELEYDKGEMDRLRSDIETILEADVIENKEKTLLDTMLALLVKRSQTKNMKFRNKKYKMIRDAIKNMDNDALIEAIYYDTDIFELRKNIADRRYNLKQLLLKPSSQIAKGTIIDLYKFINMQTNELKDIAEEIKSYLDINYIAEVEFNK